MIEPIMVSAVIPTFRRPKLVVRAVQSVLRQTYPHVEAVVVIDGIDPEARAAVEALQHRAVVCLETSQPVGPAQARNIGIRAAKGRYIGLLDDDDEWTEQKLDRQMRLIEQHGLGAQDFVISSRSQYQGDTYAVVTPRRLYAAPEDLGEYLFERSTPLSRPGLVASGSPLFPRTLALRVPFPTEAAHEEVGWWLLCITRDKVPLLMAEEVLLIQHVAAPRTAAQRNQLQNWRASLDWARKYHPYMTDRAFTALLSTTTAWRAKRQGGLKALMAVAVVMRREGHGRTMHWLMLLAIAILPLAFIDTWRRRRQS